MKPKFRSLIANSASVSRASLIVCASLGVAAPYTFAASQTWDGDTDAVWATVTNWVSNTGAPGAVAPAANALSADTATFNSALVGGTRGGVADPITYENQRQVRHILFDTANVGAYVFGAAGGNQLWLGHSGTVSMTVDSTSAQTFASDVVVRLPSGTNGTYSIANNATATGATLTFGNLLSGAAGTRPLSLTLDGTNTGLNTIGAISDQATAGAIGITKNGTGTWRISGASTIAAQTDVGVTAGVTVNAGTLIAQNAGSFGVAGNPVTVAGGNLRLDGIVLNANTIALSSGGVTANGSSTANGIAVGGAATAVTLSTTSSGDVFTLGNALNKVTGGSASTVITVNGPGTVVSAFGSNYVGAWAVDAGTLNLGAATSLGTLGSVNVAGGAKVQTLGNNVAMTVLTGSGAVSNGTAATASIVTTNIAGTNTFAGQLQNGAAGTLGLTKIGGGTLNLSGVSNYTDATIISTGVLNLTGTLGNTAVSGGSGATLSGNGTITGGITAASGVHVAPGDGGDVALGTLATGTLALDAGSELDFGITNTVTLDKITTSTLNGLTINGGQLNINGGLSAFTTNGTYPLIAYTGAIGGTGVGSLTVNGLNKSVTKTYTFTAAGGFVNLVVANSGVAQTFWNVNANGNWNLNSNWTPAAFPNAVGVFAGFGGGGTAITAPRTVTVNGAFTIGTLSFNNPTQAFTLAAGTGANLTLTNSGSDDALVTDASGNHTINSPLTLTTNGATFTVTNLADTLTVGGAIGGSGDALVKGGAGTLALSGSNTYTAETIINAGTLVVNNASSMGDPANTTTINEGMLRTTVDLISTRTFKIGDAASTISVDPGTTYTIDGVVQNAANVGVLNKTDTGTLVLNGTNTYTGGTVINAGTVRVKDADSLGNVLSGVTINNAILQATATFTGTRSVTLGSATSTISVDDTQTYTVNGVIGGTGALNKTGLGTLALGSNANTYSGGTVISAGTFAINDGSFLGAGTATFQGGTLQNNYPGGNTYGMANPIDVPLGQMGTINMGNRMAISGVVSGSGILNVNAQTTADRNDLTGSWNTFAGTINFAGTSNIRLLTQGGAFNGFSAATITMDGSVSFAGVNFSGGATTNFGMLTSNSPTTALRASQLGGQNTWSIGALNLSGTFAGQIQGGTVVKVGTGILTLSGINTYAGNTNVTDGEVALADNGGLRFVIGANGVSNKVTGAGTATLNGDFTFDLAAADLTTGNSWTIVDVTTLTESFGSTFTVVDFEDNNADNVWKKVDGNNTWSFDESTGILSLTVAPSSPYDAWALANSLTVANNGPTQDPEFDGITNALEFVLGGNPLASDTSKLPVLTTNATDFIFTFNRADESETEIALTFQYGSTIAGWTDVAIGIDNAASGSGVNITENTTSPDTVQVTIPKSSAVGGKLFGRLRAVK